VRRKVAVIDVKGRLLLEHLLTGDNVTQAAAAARMSERTAYRRIGAAEFQEHLAGARKAVVSGVVARLAGSADRIRAGATLRDVV
jgi:hypothetical protein